jgi:energy-coupling factor transporter ATP-binding protein EcfA2
MTADPSQPFLRTLAPLLRGLDRQFRAWLDTRRRYPVPTVARAEIEGLATDLTRKADALDVDRPLLVVMLMGGTGVGKSTLLNALAGAPVAQASFTRPTTRDPVVYFHQAVNSTKLDAALRLCRLVQHDRESLAQKILVDTPDLDSNDLANRDKLLELLPVADVVLYVGSQEKYHDQLGWELFKEQRRRRAFAFVLNKWDRCVDAGAGIRPDEDLLKDLAAEGFENPRLFRTTAQPWVDAAKEGREVPTDLPPGEQFAELRNWLEQGLTRLEIEAVKARGVGQLLAHLQHCLEGVRPPDLSAEASKVRDGWGRVLADEAFAQADALVGTLEPYQHEIEHHFSVHGQQRFRGLMAGYLRLTTKLKYAGTSLRDKMPGVPRLGSKVDTPADWDLAAFAQSSARVAGERVLGQRMTALTNRLLIEADQKGFPLALLNEPTAETARLAWEDRVSRCLVDALADVEREATEPTGWRRVVRGGVTILGNLLPEATLIGSILVLFYLFFVEQYVPDLARMLIPVYMTLGVLIVLHVVVVLALPVRWAMIRGEFRTRLEQKLNDELNGAFLPLPTETAAVVAAEKREVEHLAAETETVSDWLREREQAARIGELYGR